MLRRPCTLAAISFAAGAAEAGLLAVHSRAVFLLFGGMAAAVLLFLCLILSKYFTNEEDYVFLYKKVISGFLLFFVFFISGFTDAALSFSRESQLKPYSGQSVTVSGIVLSASRNTENTASITIRLQPGKFYSCGEQMIRQHREKVLVKIYRYEGIDPRLLTGCRVRVPGTVSLPQSASNPGGFNYQLYLRSEKIYACMTAKKITLESEKPARPLLNKIACFKVFYENRVMTSLQQEESALLCGIMFGDQDHMEDNLTDTFRQNGTGHLLAASGLHVGFVYAFLCIVFRKPRTTSGNLPIFVILCIYAALAGFSSSVVRSVFMITVRIISQTAVRRYDFLTSISFCGLVLLIYEPASIFSAGFLLSFTAVSSLAVLLPVTERLIPVRDLEEREMLPSEKRRYHFKKSAAATLSVTLAIQLGMAPVTWKFFHYLSPAGLFLNLPSIELAGLIVPVGLVMIPLSFMPDFLYVPAAFLVEMLLRLLLELNLLLSDSGFSCRYLPSPPTGVLLFFYFLLFFCCCETGQRVIRFIMIHSNRSSVTAFLLLLAAGASVCAGAGYTCDYAYLRNNVIFVDVGQGDCAHMKYGGKHILFDSGGSTKKDIGKEVLMPYFLGNGVGSIDLAVISHLHTDHYEGLKTLAKYVKIRKILVSEAYRSRLDEITADTGVPAPDILFATEGDEIVVGKTVIKVLAPTPRSKEEFARLADDENAENDCSLVTRAELRGFSFLFTGDIDETLEQKLTVCESGRLSSDILKVAHHGSKYSSCREFLNAVQPSAAVIQVGKNLYGHPAPEALERLNDCGAAIYRNDLQGAVMMRLLRNHTISVTAMKQNKPV